MFLVYTLSLPLVAEAYGDKAKDLKIGSVSGPDATGALISKNRDIIMLVKNQSDHPAERLNVWCHCLTHGSATMKNSGKKFGNASNDAISKGVHRTIRMILELFSVICLIISWKVRTFRLNSF